MALCIAERVLMTTSSLIRRLEALKVELPHRLHGRLERLADDIRAQGVEPNHLEPDVNETPDSSDTGDSEGEESEPQPEPECVASVTFLKGELVIRERDDQRIGSLWFQEDGLSGGKIIKLGLTRMDLDRMVMVAADLAAKIETGID
jgi:hypothetical protein